VGRRLDLVLGRFPGNVVIAVALAALVSAMDGQHGAIVHTAAPQIGKAIEETGVAWAFGRIGNCRLQHPGYLVLHLDSTPEAERRRRKVE